MMNPPEVAHAKVKKFCVTFEVTEGKTTGHVISFDHISSSIPSSLSSGALADHSSLSESSESLPNLPHCSTSNSSSGLSSRSAKHRTTKPCQCCSVLNYLKLHCLCGQGNLLFVRDVSPKDGTEPKGGVRQPEASSDMDLTDPVIPESSSASNDTANVGDTQESTPFPRIRISLRPECLDNRETEMEPEEDEPKDTPVWWKVPKWEHLMAYPDGLPNDERPISVPSHFIEDKNHSRFLTLLWCSRMVYAYKNGKPPPTGVTRVFHDPRGESELPTELYNLMKKFSDNDIAQLRKRFDEVNSMAREFSQFSGGECREHIPVDEEIDSTTNADGLQSLLPNIPSSPPTADFYHEDCCVLYPFEHDNTFRDCCEDIGDAAQIREEAAHMEVTAAEEVTAVEEVTAAGDEVSDSRITLIYAKFGKWYYPGIMECTIQDWDVSTEPITVKFYDGSADKQLQPDMIFPLSRLPPGANIQLQLESDVYEDVFFMSYEAIVHDLNQLSATLHVLSEGAPILTNFPSTALSPKDVVRIRSALKSAFYPSRIRVNFTQITPGSILGYASRYASRRVAAVAGDPRKKPKPVPVKRKNDPSENPWSSAEVPVKRKNDPSENPSSSSAEVPVKRRNDPIENPSSSAESAPNDLKQAKAEVTTTSLPQPSTAPLPPEPSSTEPSFTSSEISTNVLYLCTAPGCGRWFETEHQLMAHREKLKRNRKRQHTTMQLIPRTIDKEQQSCSIQKPIHEEVNVPGPSRPGKSRCLTIQHSEILRPLMSDSETDTSSLCTYRWSQSVQGYGLRPERCTLSDKVKSFKKLKGGNKGKCHPQTGLFSTQHFVLTNGPPHMMTTKSRKRAVDSESESTDVENYYATTLEFDVLKLQEAIECGGGHVYTDFYDVPKDLHKNPGQDLIVVSSHPTCTASYIYGVAIGCTIIRHDTVFDCVTKRKPLRDALSSGSAILLPPGWCENKMTWAPPRASPVKPLKNRLFFLALACNQVSKSYWSSLILKLGGKPVIIEESHQFSARIDRSISGIIADPKVSTRLSSQAIERGVPILNTAWVIQAVITGSEPPVSPYTVTVEDSSSCSCDLTL